MSEEIIEDMLEEVAPQIAGDYPEIAQRYKAGVPSSRTSMPPTLLLMSMRATRAS